MRRVTLLMTALALGLPAAVQAQADRRPNVIFVMTDDQTVESMRVMNNVRALQREGATFGQAIATYALCCPSRATYLTGQYSHNHGVIHNAGPFGGYKRLDNSNTLPVWLRASGYRTIHVGRYLNGYGTQNPDVTEIPPGWDEWYSTVDPTTFNFAQWRMNENGQILEKPGPDRPGEFQTDYLGRRAAERVDAAAASPQPFFLSLTFPAPHSGTPVDSDDHPSLRTPSPAPRHRNAFATKPLPRPRNFDEADVFDKPQIVADRPRLSGEDQAAIQENYQQELESLLSVDEALGNVLGALSRSGEEANTLVIFTSDNGFYHGEHRIRSEKILPYEEGIKVPLVMRGPGVPKARSVRPMVGNIDLAPTILDAADARPGRLLDGTSVFGLLADPGREPGRELVIENGQGVNSVPQFRALRNDRFLYVRHDTTGELELYDMRRDPFQMRNLEDNDRYAGLRARLARRLRALQRCRGSRCTSASRPAVRLALSQVRPRRRARSDARCLSNDVRLSLFGRDGRQVESVRYSSGRRRLGGSQRRPFAVRVRRPRLPAGRRLKLRARVITRDGRIVTVDRRVTTCPRG